MMSRSLTEAQRVELERAVRAHAPELVSVLDAFLADVRPSDDEINAMRDAVGAELVKTGLDESLEPNNRGLFLEELIDKLARITGLYQ